MRIWCFPTPNRPCHFLAFVAFLLILSAQGSANEAEKLHCSVSWVGNSFSGKQQWVAQDVADLFVDSDGTVFTNVAWDEGGANVQEYRDGKLLNTAFHTHGWGYGGGEAVAANSKYLFIAQTVTNEHGRLKGNSWPTKGVCWSGVSRRQRRDIRDGAPFPGGRGAEGDVIRGSFLPAMEIPDGQQGEIRGLCATESQLFVCCPFDNAIKIFDAGTMRQTGSWHVDHPDRICLDNRETLWVLHKAHGTNAWEASRFSLDGKKLPQQIELPKETVPAGFCADGRQRLLIADAGVDEQIKIYDDLDTAPKLSATFGARHGIFSPSPAGAFGDLRFNKPTGIGVDGKGNLYVASGGSVAGGGAVIECYTPDGRCAWRVMGLTFVDLADADPASETDIFTKEERFVLDYSRHAGGEWSYRSYTVDPFRYPDDPRLHLSPTHAWVRRIEGRRFLFVTDMTGEFLHAYRFNENSDGEIAIPCALFGRRRKDRRAAYPPHEPDKQEWLWLDHNANGSIEEGEYQTRDGDDAGPMLEPDDDGSIWNTDGRNIRCLPIQGVDVHGVPSWDFKKARVWNRPQELDQVRRVRYLARQDVMLLGGNEGKNRNQHWKPMGPVLCCYDHWNTAQRKRRWQVVLPLETGVHGHESAEPISFDVAGDFVFVAYTRGLKSEGLKWAFVKILRLGDGSIIGNLSGESELGETGLLDLVESVRVRLRANGEYLVFLEDDAKAKVILFRWTP